MKKFFAAVLVFSCSFGYIVTANPANVVVTNVAPAPKTVNSLAKAIEGADANTVLIKNPDGVPYGSGVSVIRGEDVYVWTDAHVVKEGLSVDGKTGEVNWPSYSVHKKFMDGENIEGSVESKTDLIAYDEILDIALLKVKHASPKSYTNTKFYLDKKLLPRGTGVILVGNFLDYAGGRPGVTGASTGIIGEFGRILDGKGGQKFDIIYNGSVIGGCSGSGVFIEDGRCIGLVCRMYATNVAIYSPIREIQKWAKENKLMWALDENIKK